MKVQKTLLTFGKFLLYTGLVIVGTQIVQANSLSLDWKAVGVAAVVGMVKAAMTWAATGESK